MKLRNNDDTDANRNSSVYWVHVSRSVSKHHSSRTKPGLSRIQAYKQAWHRPYKEIVSERPSITAFGRTSFEPPMNETGQRRKS